jgi:hypothetical protein
MKTKNNVEKELPAKGDLSEREQLIKLASETAAEESLMSDFMDMKYEEALREFLKNNPTKTEQDFKEEVIKINTFAGGGKVVDIRSYFKQKEPEVKKINLADYFEFGKTVASLTEDEKDVVNRLLKMSLGKED